MKTFLSPALAALLLCSSVSSSFAADAPQALVSPFNIHDIRLFHGDDKKMRVTCVKVPRPLIALATGSIYKKNDPTHSHIDEDAQAEYLKQVEPMREYVSRLSAMANIYVRSIPSKPEVAQCVGIWLYTWADKDAFSQMQSKQAFMGFGTTLSGIALSYLQVKDDPAIAPKLHEKIEAWLTKLARAQVAFVEAHPRSNSSKANHRYWTGLGVASVGIATNDRKLFQWGIDSARVGIAQITPEGILPLELMRAQKARDYHLFAVAPLVMLAEMARVNGMDLYAENNGALHKLVKFSVGNITDPSVLEERIGHKVVGFPDGDIPGNRLAWLEIYNARFPTLETEGLLNRHRPLVNAELGGDETMLFTK